MTDKIKRAVKRLPFAMNADRVYSLKRRVLHLLFPNRCPICSCIIGCDDRFCGECRSKLNSFEGSFNIPETDSFTAAFVYDKEVSPAVILMKNGVCGNAPYALGGELAERLISDGIPDNIDIIVPVPMYRADVWSRSYNQAELIAKEVGRMLGKPCVTGAVVKIRKTADQKRLDHIKRRYNLKGAFAVTDTGAVSGRRILLIDDVCTTGSTLAEIAALLKANGTASVHCAACCKTPLAAKK